MFTLLLSLPVFVFGLNYTEKQFTFDQVKNHYHVPYQERGTFHQRYWVVDDFWDKQDGPVFLYLCGEYECPGVDENVLYPLMLAEEYDAKFVVLEHRYYGYSLPYSFSSMLPQLFFFLTVEQALGDIEHFIHEMNDEIQDLREGPSPKWIIIGGGYPGALAAYFRTRHPDLVVGAWASSAKVKPILNFTDYDKQVYLSAKKSGEDCVEAIRSVNDLTEDQYRIGQTEKVTDVFGVTEDFVFNDYRPVLFYVSDVMSRVIVRGHRTELCNAITSTNDPWTRLKYVSDIGKKYGLTDPKYYALRHMRTLIWTPEGAGRQWYWQKCTQLAWFQTPSEYRMRSSHLDLAFWNWFCNLIFDYPGGMNPPDIHVTESKVNWAGSKILFTQGEEDPWKWSGVMEQENELRPYILIDCDNCAHTQDIKTPTDQDPIELTDARERIKEILREFLRD